MTFSLKKLLPLALLAGCQVTDETANKTDTASPESAPQVLCEGGLLTTSPTSCDEQPITETSLLLQEAVETEIVDAITEVESTPQVIEDVWIRVQRQLTMPIPDNARINAQRNWYLRHPDYMQRVAKRAQPFMFMITETIESQQMPLELALLPIVESAFDPFAYSHGRAAGMWQFIPGTGKRFGMKQTWWYDGRRDVVASTQGAIDYLTYLYDYFDGNWLHALAAYNSGEGRVKRAIRKNRNAGKPTDFWSLDLPRETRAYVPKLLALSDILQRKDELGFDFPIIPNQPVVESIDIGSQIDLAFAADMVGISLKQLHGLNPGFNRWATDPDGPHRLLVPVENAEQFKISLAQTDNQERLNWERYQVKSGDSLLKLAKKFHTTVGIISKVNELDSNVIIAGDHLLIPVALRSLDAYSLSTEQRLANTQSKKRGRYKLTHKVKSGDTMWDISRAHNVNIRSLAKWNGMAPTDTLRPGKELVIWVNQVSRQQRENAIVRALTYTVRSGDSLARIANRFNVKIADLTKWNQLDKSKYLQPGQKIKVFVDVTQG